MDKESLLNNLLTIRRPIVVTIFRCRENIVSTITRLTQGGFSIQLQDSGHGVLQWNEPLSRKRLQ